MAKVVGQVQAKGPEPRFQALTDPIEIRRLFDQASSSHPQVDVQFSSLPTKFRARVADPSTQDHIQLEFADDTYADVRRAIEPLIASPDSPLECMLIVFLKGLLLLGVRSTRIELGEKRMSVLAPMRFFKIQRRKEHRLDIPSGYDFFITIDAVEGSARKVQKRLLDISSSGLGFQVVSPREAGLFQSGTILRNCLLGIQNREFLVDIEVCSLVPIPQDRKWTGTKVGCKIVRVSPSDAEYLASYVTANIAIWR